MLSKKFYKLLGMRVKLMQILGTTYYEWDDKKEHLVMAKPFLLFNMYEFLSITYIHFYKHYLYMCVIFRYVCLYMGNTNFVIIHIIQMYLRTHEKEIDEEGLIGPKPKDLKRFATLMIEGGEIMLITCLALLNYVFFQRLDIFKFLFNELLDYNKKLSGKYTTLMLTNFPKLLKLKF